MSRRFRGVGGVSGCRLVVVALALVLLAVAASPAGAVKLRKARVQHISELYVLTSGGGTLRALPGRRFAVTLTRVDRNVVWFSDRPARRSGAFPSSGLAAAWKGFGFVSQPPNAALVYPDPGGDGSTVILELGRARYNARANSISFTARWIDPRTVRSGNLADHAKVADPTPNQRFSNASLFIDATTAEVINGCVIQPNTDCLYLNLNGADLAGADLGGSDFTEADLTRANLAGANLLAVEFYGAVIPYANLSGANFSRADLTGASLFKSVVTGANFTDATFCHTTMPDGSINNSGCG
jgi:hypothetical protein